MNNIVYCFVRFPVDSRRSLVIGSLATSLAITKTITVFAGFINNSTINSTSGLAPLPFRTRPCTLSVLELIFATETHRGGNARPDRALAWVTTAVPIRICLTRPTRHALLRDDLIACNLERPGRTGPGGIAILVFEHFPFPRTLVRIWSF